MKTKLVLGFALLLGLLVLTRASVFNFVGAPVTVDTTTSNFTSVTFPQSSFPSFMFAVQNYTTLTNVNQVTVYQQLSLDNTNWLNVATYHPSATNAPLDYWRPDTANQTVYMRLQVVTLTNVQINITGQ
jgi:hypothetical protein